MKKYKDFAHEKLENLFDGGDCEKLEITDSLNNRINRLPPQKEIAAPLYRRKIFISAAAACCVFLICFAFLLPELNGYKNKDNSFYDSAPESAVSESNEVYTAVTRILSGARTDTSQSSDDYKNEYGNVSYGRLVITKTVSFTASPLNGGASYIENICGAGALNITVSEFELYIDGNPPVYSSIVILSGTKGKLSLIGEKSRIEGETLIFDSDNTLKGMYAHTADKIEISLNIADGCFDYSVGSEYQNTYAGSSDTKTDTQVREFYLYN